jgi:hypothetical protein
MSRLIRVSFVALLAICAAGAYANVPSATLSSVPDAINLSPGIRYASNPIGGYTVHVEGALGPVSGSFVEVEVSPDADVLVSWCQAGTWGGAQVHPVLTGFTDANGNKTFTYFGGSCLDPNDFFGATFIAQVRADGIVLDEPFINSPDVVNSSGKKATDEPPTGGIKRCDLVASVNVSQVSLSDAVFHTRPIKLGLREACSKFTPDAGSAPRLTFSGPVGVSDAVFLTPYIKNGNKCNCQ